MVDSITKKKIMNNMFYIKDFGQRFYILESDHRVLEERIFTTYMLVWKDK